MGGEVVGDGAAEITGVASIQEARPGELTFASNPRYDRFIAETAAAAVIIEAGRADVTRPDGVSLLLCEDPYRAFAAAMTLFAPEGDAVAPGVHESAVVAASVEVGSGVAIGANVVIMDGSTLGDGATIHPGVFVGGSVDIGRDTVLYPNVTVRNGSVLGERVIVHPGTVIGSDGFGFARSDDCHRKVPQIGNVVIEDDVEIGANVCIDRATLGSTRICRGSKIDNLVQIAHNVVIGEGSLIIAQVGVSGSTRVGKGVVLAGQAGIAGHIEIGDGAMVGAQAGVTKSVPAGQRVSGYPAREHSAAKRLYAFTENLPKLTSSVRELERRLANLEGSRETERSEKED